MGHTVGVFKTEQQVLDAIQLLKSAGAHLKDLKVVVKNEESAPLLSANSEVPLTDVTGIREARDRTVRHEDADGWVGEEPRGQIAGLMAVPQTNGLAGYSGAGAVLPASGLVDWDVDRKPHTDRVLEDLGLPHSAAQKLAGAVEDGSFLLVTDERPDEQSEQLLKQAGALDIVH